MSEFRRFFTSDSSIVTDEQIVLRDAEHKHLSKVLRMQVGQRVVVCTPWQECLCDILDISTNQTTLRRIESSQLFCGYPVVLYLGLIKGERNELAIQKAVEAGVQAIVPFFSRNTVVKPDVDKSVRIRRIAQEACKQSGRGGVNVSDCLSFDQMLQHTKQCKTVFLCNEHEKQPIYLLDKLLECYSDSSIGVIVGSEGGFTAQEVQNAMEHGAISVSLGKTILRAETAAMAASVLCCAAYLRAENR